MSLRSIYEVIAVSVIERLKQKVEDAAEARALAKMDVMIEVLKSINSKLDEIIKLLKEDKR